MARVKGVPTLVEEGTLAVMWSSGPTASTVRLTLSPPLASVMTSAWTGDGSVAELVLIPATKSLGALGVSLPALSLQVAGPANPVATLPAASRARALTVNGAPALSDGGAEISRWSAGPITLKLRLWPVI